MYYVNEEQIQSRFNVLPVIREAVEALQEKDVWGAAEYFAGERALHLALEIVTDVGSLLIDGFIMRDASSYEDIIDILKGEEVFPDSLYEPLLKLVKLRRALVQDYSELQRLGKESLFPLTELPSLLEQFAESVNRFIIASKF
ncbi:DUF86 domain-containing protein [Paenibacillus turpanensis]|uniref:DUF86 domain-containing protein n=1 Tax=Paenibacillus turpanensis TaxID=2689078 RepID=UPI00140B6B13|nr:HepT-like ribonuclease domain-containing protein [Paenibacillus turpanensis]